MAPVATGNRISALSVWIALGLAAVPFISAINARVSSLTVWDLYDALTANPRSPAEHLDGTQKNESLFSKGTSCSFCLTFGDS